jgi:hypothetical protein
MNSENRFVVLFSVAAVLVLLAACGAPEPTGTLVPTPEPVVIPTDTLLAPAEANAAIAVTFDGDECVYEGPDRVLAGGVPLVLDVEHQTDHPAYGVIVVTLDEGKTFEDLDAWPSTTRPRWIDTVGDLVNIPQGTRAETTFRAFEGPLFVVCFTAAPFTKSGVLGPIEVEPVTSQ